MKLQSQLHYGINRLVGMKNHCLNGEIRQVSNSETSQREIIHLCKVRRDANVVLCIRRNLCIVLALPPKYIDTFFRFVYCPLLSHSDSTSRIYALWIRSEAGQPTETHNVNRANFFIARQQ